MGSGHTNAVIDDKWLATSLSMNDATNQIISPQSFLYDNERCSFLFTVQKTNGMLRISYNIIKRESVLQRIRIKNQLRYWKASP